MNRDHILLKRSEFENTEPLLTLPQLPVETGENSAETNSIKETSPETVEDLTESNSIIDNSNDTESLELIEIVRKTLVPAPVPADEVEAVEEIPDHPPPAC